MKQQIKIFDTTLRDGEQSPGASMNIKEKVQIASQLERLGVDIIEAGFAAASVGDFNAISEICQNVHKPIICSLARAVDNDIKKAGEALMSAKNKRIHTFIATSDIHMQHKLKMSKEEVIKRAINAVKYASTFTDDVEFSCEDAGRSDIAFLKEVCDAVIGAGAKTINLPDTVGIMLPTEIGKMVKDISDYVGSRAIISVHNHNDLGLGVANSLEAVVNGARQIECTINGIGERAGNAALEEIIMTMKTRSDIYGDFETNVNTKEIYPTSRLVANITGINPQPNKAIVGSNAFAHESGIHQDGMLKNKTTYQIIEPEEIGYSVDDTLVLGKHSGRAAFKDKLVKLGFNLSEDEIEVAFVKFKELCDHKKAIFDDDIRAIALNEIGQVEKVFELKGLQVMDCSKGVASSTCTLNCNNETIIEASVGEGSVDSIFKSIDRATNHTGKLLSYKVNSVSEGKDALASVSVKVLFNDDISVLGHGLDIDTMNASGKAYVDALNSYLSLKV